MFELFKAEAASHAAALNEGLLAIEANPEDTSHVDQLMRAAHSVKGAARIVGLDAVVELAHAMEDRLLAVQQGQEKLTSPRVDQLLRGVDVFQELSKLAEDDLDRWLAEMQESCATLTASLGQPVVAPPPSASEAGSPPVAIEDATSETAADAAAPSPEAVPAPLVEPPAVEVKPSAAPPPAEKTADSAAERTTDQRTVPVAATNLNRIMRLASESMVEARRLQSMRQSLAALTDTRRQVTDVLDRLESADHTRPASEHTWEDLRRLNHRSQELLQQHGASLERALWRSERTSTELYHQVIGSRMRPFVEGTQAFPRMIRDLARSLGKKVSFEVLGGSVGVDRDILRKLEAPLNHILRNCVDHAIEAPEARRAAGKPETGRVVLDARHHAGMLIVVARDDGRGIDVEVLRRRVVERELVDEVMAAELSNDELLEFLFLPGFSTAGQVTEVSGRGVGLDVVRNMVQEVAGTVRVESTVGQGTTFTLRLPVTLSVIRAALAEIGGELYAFPLAKLVRIVRVPADEIHPVQGRQQFSLDDQSVGLVRGSEILDLPDATADTEAVSVVVIGQDQQPCGIAVDRFVGEQDLVVRPLDPRLGKVPHMASAALTETGEPLLIVDVDDMLQSIRQLLGEGRLRGMRSISELPSSVKSKVLVVDDSITVREVERQLLVTHGYDVDVAVDGQDGWHALCQGKYDLLITDVDMPRMNGIELIEAVRRDARFDRLPVVIVSYKDREEDRVRGVEAGANAYLTKGSFHDDSFVQTVHDLIAKVD